jgi:hypothetical protein
MIVTLPYDPDWKALAWIYENCPSYITSSMNSESDSNLRHWLVDYHFSEQADAVLFALRWL